jgi:hypothetical protein
VELVVFSAGLFTVVFFEEEQPANDQIEIIRMNAFFMQLYFTLSVQ